MSETMHGVPWDKVFQIALAVFASTGFWTGFWNWLNNKQVGRTAWQRMILGIGYNNICDRIDKYRDRGYITRSEYSDLKKYLVKPYHDLHGDGTVDRMLLELDKLPIRED